MRFFFNFRSTTHYFRDREGEELESLEAALKEGRLAAIDLVGDDIGALSPEYVGGVFEITDEEGAIVGLTEFDSDPTTH
jgi:hypothetical protein